MSSYSLQLQQQLLEDLDGAFPSTSLKLHLQEVLQSSLPRVRRTTCLMSDSEQYP